MWLHSLKVAQLLRSAACLHTNQSRSYLNPLVARFCSLNTHILLVEFPLFKQSALLREYKIVLSEINAASDYTATNISFDNLRNTVDVRTSTVAQYRQRQQTNLRYFMI